MGGGRERWGGRLHMKCRPSGSNCIPRFPTLLFDNYIYPRVDQVTCYAIYVKSPNTCRKMSTKRWSTTGHVPFRPPPPPPPPSFRIYTNSYKWTALSPPPPPPPPPPPVFSFRASSGKTAYLVGTSATTTTTPPIIQDAYSRISI